jgi:hypothetical protein
MHTHAGDSRDCSDEVPWILRFLGKQITGWELPTGMRFGLPGVDRLSGCNRREKTGVLAMLPRSIKN